MNAAELLGLPLIPAYNGATGNEVLQGVNYASAAAGILDATGRNFVSKNINHFTFNSILTDINFKIINSLKINFVTAGWTHTV